MTLEAEPVSPGEALSGKLSGKLPRARYFRFCANINTTHNDSGLCIVYTQISYTGKFVVYLLKLLLSKTRSSCFFTSFLSGIHNCPL